MSALTVRTINNTTMRFDDREYGWSFGDTMLSVWSEDRKVRHFFPFATADRITITES